MWFKSKRSRRLFAALISCAAVVAACASAPPQPAPAPPPAAKPMPIAYGEYFQRTRLLGVTELENESAKLSASGAPEQRLQLAMILSAPANPSRDDVRALALSEELSQNPGIDIALRDAASLYTSWLTEYQRNEISVHRCLQRASDDQRRVETLESKLRDAERRAQEAERKLAAIMDIDKTLSERRAPPSPTAAPAPAPVPTPAVPPTAPAPK